MSDSTVAGVRNLNLAQAWLAQAENDFSFAQATAREGFHAQCCFICQQVAEKALKSILHRRGARQVMTHSLTQMCRVLKINGQLLRAASVLDQYYVTSRYPDALAGLAPYQVFQKFQATEALQLASLFLKKARGVSSRRAAGKKRRPA
jgi:HEPN domain-containing protein